jgi:Glycosyl hydrolase catalytic core
MRKKDALSVVGTFALVLLAACGAGGDGTSTGLDGGRTTGSTSGGGAGGATDGPTGNDDGSPGSGSASDASTADDPGSAPGDAGSSPTDASATDGGSSSRDAGSASGASGCKRGIASNMAPSTALAPTASSPGVSWWYNWAISGSGGAPAIEFVPMVWGSSTAKSALPAGARYVLGFNEPNFMAQSNLSPQQAAAAWPDIEAHAKTAGIPLVSPAVNFCGSASDSSQCTVSTITDPYTYLKDFFAACSGCEVDYIAVHWYNCDLPSLKAYIEGNTSTGGGLQGFVQFGKPIWLTEFSCGGGSSVANQTAYMKAAVPYLEGSANIARYSWFSASPIPNAQLMNGDGTLTDLGKTYVSLPESCH